MIRPNELRNLSYQRQGKKRITLKELEELLREAANDGKLEFTIGTGSFVSTDDIKLLEELGYRVYVPICEASYSLQINW